jgi:hypothetical protein
MMVNFLYHFLLAVSLFSFNQASGQPLDTCSLHILPAVQLKKNSTFLSKAGKANRDKIIVEANNHPACKIKVCGNGPYTEAGLQFSWDQAETVVEYLVGKGINRARIILNYEDRRGVTGDEVILFLTNSSELINIPPPFPGLSYHKLTPKRAQNLHN